MKTFEQFTEEDRSIIVQPQRDGRVVYAMIQDDRTDAAIMHGYCVIKTNAPELCKPLRNTLSGAYDA